MPDSGSPSRPDGPLRVMVVDADDRVRESLAGLLVIGERLVIVGTAGHIGTALDLAREHQPDAVIVDPRLPDVDGGIVLIQRIRELAPGVRVLAMSWSDDLEHPGIDCGADGYVRKTFRPNELIAAVVAACHQVRR